MEPLSRFEMPPTERNYLILKRTVEHTRCRVCWAPLVPAFDLGPMFVSDFPQVLEDRGPKVPLALAVCDNRECQLVQLTHTVPRDALYRTRYWYRSGVNESMRKELESVAQWGLDRVGRLTFSDVILDIGANDGTLLDACAEKVVGLTSPPRLWAVEPSPQFANELLSGPVERVISDYFPPQHPTYIAELANLSPKPRLIFSIAMFYDLEDPHAFVSAIARLLHPEGVWVVQMGDLASMLETSGFDTICHEHLELYSLRSFMFLIQQHGLAVVDCTYSGVNGGSLRIAVKHAANPLPINTGNLALCLAIEDNLMSAGPLQALLDFASDVQHRCSVLQRALMAQTINGTALELLGASTKGNTLLQRLNLGPELCHRAIERSYEKAGRMTVTGILIVSEEAGQDMPAPLRLVLPWHFKEGLIEREKDYLKGGGKLVFPLPEPTIVWMQDGKVKERPL